MFIGRHIGAQARRRLESSEDFEELKTLVRCDRDGRKPGGDAPELAEAIEYLRELVADVRRVKPPKRPQNLPTLPSFLRLP